MGKTAFLQQLREFGSIMAGKPFLAFRFGFLSVLSAVHRPSYFRGKRSQKEKGYGESDGSVKHMTCVQASLSFSLHPDGRSSSCETRIHSNQRNPHYRMKKRTLRDCHNHLCLHDRAVFGGEVLHYPIHGITAEGE